MLFRAISIGIVVYMLWNRAEWLHTMNYGPRMDALGTFLWVLACAFVVCMFWSAADNEAEEARRNRAWEGRNAASEPPKGPR